MASSYNNKYKLLMQLDTCVDTDIPKAERIRSKLMQVNASKDNTNSAHIEAIKTDLTKQLFAITDSNESTDKIGAAVEQLLSNSGRQRVHRNEWKCALNDMTHEQMAQTFKLDRKVTNKCDKLVIPCNTEDFVKCNDKSDFEIIDISSQSTSDGNQSQPVVDNGSDSENSLLIKLNRFHNLSKGNQNSVNKSTDKCTLIEDKTVKKSQTKRKICSSPSGLFKKQTVGDSPHQTPNKNKTVETDETESSAPLSPQFITGREKQIVDRLRKSGDIVEARKSLTASRQFIPPKIKQKYDNENNNVSLLSQSLLNDERLKNIDPKMIELINNEIIESKKTDWNDIAGLEYVKKKLKEILVLPLIRPDLFTGIRTPPKGLLLFGPPGTGKTLIGRCVASQSNSTFFSITASSLTSKWVGVGEKMVKAMFAVSKVKQPSVIFIDEIDSLLTQRCDSEHESSRRLKTEFLAQFDGVNTSSDDRVLIIGATNRPQELDEAARRRFTSRIYIPLPDINARKQIIENCMKEEKHSLTEEEMVLLAQRTDGYSGADMFNLCRESAMESYRDDSLLFDNIDQIEKNEIRAINYNDFVTNLDIIRPSVCDTDLQVYQMFNNKFGTNLQKK